MMRDIEYMEAAKVDIVRLNDFIENRCKAPLTAFRYLEGLEGRIQWLRGNADLFPIEPELTFSMGIEIRRLNYEKMAILYSIDGDMVNIQRIIPQNMVIY